ncbi:hypothetical protein J5226_07765 [Lysobacter sp. K5869]|uniref:hypothetical protein n=1 Tax=Lysobacter sp. K5869 TaxID=2820808 RepID=UPI001C0624E6|nr:hypothetical protein [Lysobacter sp. K5869]QWP78280.1 hypothetical protein J5226_07765 [Lysobacter sp. K5869]
MKAARIFAGLLCILASFAVIALLGFGTMDPAAPASATPALAALLPSVALGLSVFAVGLWLLFGGRKR